jgi:peptidoglycan hydrolase-like protein with peptidoglycan-binding domain
LSNFTPENSYSSDINIGNKDSKNKIVFANELGILEDINGYTVFDSDDISVSDTFLNVDMYDKKYFINDIAKNTFVHSYFISRWYTLLPRGFVTFNNLDDFIPESQIPKSIKVLDKNGELYVDAETGLNRYRILLDQLNLDKYSTRETLPTKIIVLFDSPAPSDLQLVYDKVSLSPNELITAVVPQHTENINTVSFFNKSLEESSVVDNSSRNKKVYAKKSLATKNNLINSTNHSSEGFEIFVPKKALSDSRTYESFNWRLVTKVNRSINVSSVNNGEDIDSEDNIKQKVVNCAVLCTSAQLASMIQTSEYSSANPYVFFRLEQSPFNISKYTFSNPMVDVKTFSKETARYWLLDIDNVNDADLAMYDILTWSPVSGITTDQSLKLKKYVQSTQGTLVLDLSQSPVGAEYIDPSLSVSSSAYALDTWTYNTSNLLLDETKSNAWPINSSIFETLTIDSTNYNIYSIFGRNNLSNLTTNKTAKEFTGAIAESNVLLKNSRSKPLFVSLQYTPNTDALSRGVVLATTTQFLKYCNDVYQPSSIFDTAVSNNKSSSILENPFTASAVIEGPMKLLYNTTAVALLSRAFSSKTQDIRSSIYYQLSDWKSNYVINGNVLLEDEIKEEYTTVKEKTFDPIGTTKYAKNLLSQGGSILSLYKDAVYDSLSDQHSLSLQDIDLSNLDFYIEITNPDVILANATKVTNDYASQNVNEIPTSYTLFKINAENINSAMYAYTDSPSAQFVVPGGFGPYVIRHRNYRSSNQLTTGNSSANSLSSSYKSYPFNFSIFNSYIESSESPLQFSANWKAQLSATYTASLSREELKTVPAHYDPLDVDRGIVLHTPDQNDSGITTLTSIGAGFMYSGDIDAGNKNIVYEKNKGGLDPNYTKYIQISLRDFGQPNLPLNGVYDASLEAGVKAWQSSVGTPTDGKVDSQTKSTLAKAWKDMDAAQYEGVLARVKSGTNKASAKYIEAARASVAIDELASNHPFKKIGYTGSTAAANIVDIITAYTPSALKTDPKFSNVIVKNIRVSPGAFAGSSGYPGITINAIDALSSRRYSKIN